LHQQGFVIFQRAQRRDDCVIAIPVARRLPASAVDDQIFGLLRDFRVEVVHQHAQRSFLLPALAGKSGAAWRAHRLIPGGFFGG
jgi:hypothetical protein